ncbi:serine/threonine protein kinase [Verrucomicrobiaceae bacterium 5K15]|uniref:Serine/threonine protein kinase n=1 Tax=Oceaniferula flava TaxID=2800421 RepID=A0AAE2SBF8_9BACT|nr:serine/threonine-protein kinase [Oceaniferula flavus]MBK1853937.1 serine/threonine protein kinase [Oceaniferula flavus]MBM1135243.1 serine/threonine protein kinase [Oceaniferula flavus]
MSDSLSIYRSLYDEADELTGDLTEGATEALCPLYHALEKIENRYENEELIGQGGMKQVLRVYDRQTEREVALALPRNDFAPERYDAFLREAHITARLEHPNIIKLFDMGIDAEGRPFFTMEFKRGLSLRKILSQLRADKELDRYPVSQRLSIFLKICEAMAYAHSRHVLHLDLKPENIQIGTFGEVQVCDWGMGEIVRGDSERQSAEALLDPDLYGDQLEPAVKGTPGYMAPEQESARVAKSAQTDIYALGCMLYELVTLLPPDARSSKPASSKAISAIVDKACAESPYDRYLSVDMMHSDVNRHLMGFSVGAEKAGFLREMRLFYRRHKLTSTITLLFTIFLLGVAFFFTQKLKDSYDNTAQALDTTALALTTAEQERDRAEQALNKYLKEKEYSAALLESQDADTLDGTLMLMEDVIMHEGIGEVAIQRAMDKLDERLKVSQEKSNRAWTLKAYLYFLTQRFVEAEIYYKMRTGDQQELRDVIPEFAPLVRKEDGLLPPEAFIRLMGKIMEFKGRNRAPLIEKMVTYDSLKRSSLEERTRIIRAFLQLSNPKWLSTRFEYDARQRHLKLSGNMLTTLFRPRVSATNPSKNARSVLRLLPIRSLELATPMLHDYRQLRGLGVEVLDISKMPAKNLAPLATMKSLRVLIVRPGQFGRLQLDQLPAHVTVRVHDTREE